MYITPTEYLNLTERIKLLTAKCEELHLENSTIKQANYRYKQNVRFLEEEKRILVDKEKQAKRQLAEHVTIQSNAIKEYFRMTNIQQQEYISDQIIELSQDTNARKLKDLQEKMKEDKLRYEKYIEFHERIKTLYHSCTRKKESPSLEQLAIWVEEGRQNDIQVNDFTKGILDLMLGPNILGSTKNLSKSGKKLSNNNDFKNSMILNGSKNKGKKSEKNLRETNNANIEEELNQEDNENEKENPPKQIGFIEAIMMAAKEKQKENLQAS